MPTTDRHEMWLEPTRIWTELGQRSWSDVSFDHARRLIDVQEACVKAMVGAPKPVESTAA